jgi:hypothetical protein
MKIQRADKRRLPDAFVLLAALDDDEAFRLWCEQLDEIAALPVTRSWRRTRRRRHAARTFRR